MVLMAANSGGKGSGTFAQTTEVLYHIFPSLSIDLSDFFTENADFFSISIYNIPFSAFSYSRKREKRSIGRKGQSAFFRKFLGFFFFYVKKRSY